MVTETEAEMAALQRLLLTKLSYSRDTTLKCDIHGIATVSLEGQ